MAAEEWDVFSLAPGGDYDAPEFLATLYNAAQKTVRVELDGAGAGSFAINRSAPECTETILAQGNLVKVRFPEIHDDYIFAFFIETGDFALISSQEAGGEMLNFGGRGILSYLEYARAASESFIDGGMSPIAGLWNAYLAGTGAKPGQILRRLLEEFQHVDRVYPVIASHPVPLLTIDFDYDDDSTGDPWDATDATDEFKYQVGEDGLAIVQRLWETETITVQMGADFLLSAYNRDNFGRDLTGDAFGAGVVRFERGVNIATELRREQAASRVVTNNLVQGEADKYGGAVLADAASRVTKEGFVAAFGVTTTALDAIGAADLQQRLNESDLIQFPINNRRTDLSLDDPVTVGSVKAIPGLAVAGYYLPGPEGTNGDFWVGDTVRVHTGAGPFDYNEVDALVKAITISREDDNAELAVFVELGSPVQVPGVPSYFTSTNLGSCEIGTWPLGPPSESALLIGYLCQRDVSPYDASIVPVGVDEPAGHEGCSDNEIAGTEWTFIDNLDVNNGAGQGARLTFAYRNAEASEPQVIQWGGPSGGGFSGTARPRSHQVAIEGLSGAPTVTAKGTGTNSGTANYTSPAITVPAAGWIFAGFGYRAGFMTGSMVVRAPAVAMTEGLAYGGYPFDPYSWFGYLHVAAAGTYNIVLDRTNTVGTVHAKGWIVGFWPE
jgi:hypothetical protein